MTKLVIRPCGLLIVSMFLMLSGCGKSGLSGTYSSADANDRRKITFSSGDKVEVHLDLGFGLNTVACTYVTEGKTVKITAPDGDVYAFTIDDNGCLVSDNVLVGGAPLCKNGSSSKAAAPGSPMSNAESQKQDSKSETTDREGLTATDREAIRFVHSKIEECYLKGPDTWTTRLRTRDGSGKWIPKETGATFQQFRPFEFDIVPSRYFEADSTWKERMPPLQGSDYFAQIRVVKVFQGRYYDGTKGWSPWGRGGLGTEVAVERRNGEWLITERRYITVPKTLESKWVRTELEIFYGVKPEPASVPADK